VARPDGTLLAGHGIIAAARAEGLEEFPCVIFDGSDAEARALMVADNEQARLAVDDPGRLAALLGEVSAAGLLGVTGHDAESLAGLLAGLEPEAEAVLPEEFKEYDPADMEFQHQCPKCGYEWGDVQ